MPTLEFWPQQPHNLLVVGDDTLTAGDTFEASEQDVEELLGNPEIRRPEAEVAGAPGDPALTSIDEPGDSKDGEKDPDPQTHSPGRAERSNPTDRRI